MDIVWADEAFQRWCEAADYILRQHGIRAVEKFQKDTEEWEDSLSANPQIGKVEPLLANRDKLYRGVVINKLNKLIYYIEKDTIIIADFWDTRREPKTQAGSLKNQRQFSIRDRFARNFTNRPKSYKYKWFKFRELFFNKEPLARRSQYSECGESFLMGKPDEWNPADFSEYGTPAIRFPSLPSHGIEKKKIRFISSIGYAELKVRCYRNLWVVYITSDNWVNEILRDFE